MKLASTAGGVLVGLFLVTGSANALEVSSTPRTKNSKVTIKKAKPATKKSQADKRLQEQEQMQREAAARAKVEQEARLRAEAEAKRLAEADAREQPLRAADQLLKDGKPADAYALLEPLEFERSGDVRFDYLLGIAALDSGKPDKATLAFERVLAVEPNFAGARLDLARAYYQLGDMPRAKTEFATVMGQQPPEGAKVTVQKYLDAIQAQEDAKKLRISGYVESMVGRDSNVNSSTSQAQIAVPAFGNLVFTLNPSNLKKADNYAGVAGGVELNQIFDSGLAVYAGIDARQRSNFNESSFNSLSVDGRAGLAYSKGAETFRLGLTAGQYSLDGDHNRDSTGLGAEWKHTFNPANQMNAYAQHTRYRFVDAAIKTNDFDQSIVGLGWVHVMNEGKAIAFASYFAGEENDVAPVTATNPSGGRADGNKRFDGVRIGGQTMLNESFDLFASIGLQEGKYDKINAAFLTKRSDRLKDLALGLNWRPAKLWTIRPQLTMFRNASNISIYDYKRTDVSLTVRRDFN